jgi:uncharacterized protein YjiS (DUF1127 family)
MSTRIMEGTANAGQIPRTMTMPSVVPRAGRATTSAMQPGSWWVHYARKIVLAQRTRTELGALSDIELRDIGLTRADIDAVATGAFTR